MATHWLSFRIADDRTYRQRYEALVAAIQTHSTKWWLDTSSFFVFESVHSIDTIASAVKEAIDEDTDVILIGMTDFKSARLIGANQDKDIFDLIPFVKKV